MSGGHRISVDVSVYIFTLIFTLIQGVREMGGRGTVLVYVDLFIEAKK